MRRGIEAFRKCEDMISKLGLFSANESRDDISTSNLKYILVSDCFLVFFFCCFRVGYDAYRGNDAAGNSRRRFVLNLAEEN